jgi:hypothetical protein
MHDRRGAEELRSDSGLLQALDKFAALGRWRE